MKVMRATRVALLAALAALGTAACTVTTTGAPCASDGNCPTDQGCGGDGTCSAAALQCPGYVAGVGVCRVGASCDASGNLVACESTGGACAEVKAPQACPVHQTCQGAAGAAACACAPTPCSAGVASYCDGGRVATCAQDTSNALGCWYASGAAACPSPQVCAAAGGAASCQCPPSGAALGQSCSTEGALACGGGQSLLCATPAGSTCRVWTVAADCAAGGLVCEAVTATCACPPNVGPDFFADAVAGSATSATPRPTGVESPAGCRFASLADALDQANMRGPGSAVKATGWASSLPGGVMTFAATGALSVGPGVTLTTADAPPRTDHYVVTAPDTAGTPFITLAAGAALSGFEVRNTACTANAIQSNCGTRTDTVTIQAVKVTGTGAGTPSPRFNTGLFHSGICSLLLGASSISGASDSGVVLDNMAAATSATLRDNLISDNDATTQYLVGGTSRRGGGIVLFGSLPGTLLFRGNRICRNVWDQVLVKASGNVSLSGGTDATACGATSNFIGYYPFPAGGTGVGIATAATSVDVAYDQWLVSVPVSGTDYIGNVINTNLTCAPATITCP